MRLPRATKVEIDFGLSTLGKSLPWASAETFTLYFLTDIVGMPALDAGMAVLLFFLWNAVCDPLMGWVLDRWGPAGMLSRRYYAIAALLASLSFVLSFTDLPGARSGSVLLIAGLAFRTAYAALDVPHNALLVRLGDLGQPRLGLSAARQAASLTATFVVTFAARPLLQFGGTGPTQGYVVYAAGVAIVGAILFLGFFPVSEAPSPLVEAQPDPAGPPTSRKSILAAVGAIMLTATIGALVAGAFAKDIVYLAKYVFHDAAWTLDALTALMIGRFLAVPLWWLAPRRIGLPTAAALAWLLLAFAGIALSSMPPSKGLFEIGLLVIGLGLGGINALAWAIIPQLAHRFAQGRAATADSRIFGMFTAMTKVASGLSGLLVGWLLQRSGVADAPVATALQAGRFYAMACFIPVPAAMLGLACLLGLGSRAGPLSAGRSGRIA